MSVCTNFKNYQCVYYFNGTSIITFMTVFYLHLIVLLCFTIGVPSCAVVDITSPVASSATATWKALNHPWFLPVWFEEVVTSGSQTKSISTTENEINISSLQHMTAYAISVTPCNTVGYREGCPPYVVNITTPPVNATAPPTKGILAFNASIYIVSHPG